MDCSNCLSFNICIFHQTGRENESCSEYKAGYRKASDVAREIVETARIEVEKYRNDTTLSEAVRDLVQIIYEDILAELKKKYESEV